MIDAPKPAEKQRGHLGREELKNAALWRFADGLTWGRIAIKLNCGARTLYDARQTETWAEVAEEVRQELRAEGGPLAWGGLTRAARANDVPACKEILNRIEGAVPQKSDMTVSGDETKPPILIDLIGIDKTVEYARNGSGPDSKPDDDAPTGEGGPE